jgi:hypothetical protein
MEWRVLLAAALFLVLLALVILLAVSTLQVSSQTQKYLEDAEPTNKWWLKFVFRDASGNIIYPY